MTPPVEPIGGAATPKHEREEVRRERFARCPTTEWLEESRNELLLLRRCAVVSGTALPPENEKGGEASAEALCRAAVARGGADHGRVRRRFGRNYDRCFRCSDPSVREHRGCHQPRRRLHHLKPSSAWRAGSSPPEEPAFLIFDRTSTVLSHYT